MKKLALLLITVTLGLTSCVKSPTEKLSELKSPVILVAESAQKDMLMESSIFTVVLRGADGKILTLTNNGVANSIGASYDTNDTIIK
jgi:hypothetical protein